MLLRLPRHAERRGSARAAPRSLPARGRAVLATLALAVPAGRALAFDTQGHAVIEALAYRTLAEGRGGEPARPDVLRDLINDGAIEAPWCFGRGDVPPAECRDAAATNPLLCWPHPQADRPDAFFRRQFTDAGQCFHYMGTLTDSLTPVLPGTSIPRALATSAVVRCNDLLDGLLRQVVVEGGPGTRRSGFGLYELIHAIEDSFSGAHSERAGDEIGYLRVWKPIEKLAGLPTEQSSLIPAGVFHTWADHRDKTFVVEEGTGGCRTGSGEPYEVPYACLSGEGDRARQAVVELLVVVRDLRLAQLAAPRGTDTRPETSAGWRRFRAKWFTPVHRCEGEECDVRQPPEASTGRYAFLGVDTRGNPTANTVDVVARGSVLRYAEGINPFVYALSATLGYRAVKDQGSYTLAGVGLDLILPLGMKAGLGFTPAELRTAFGGGAGGSDVVTRLLRFDYLTTQGVMLSAEAPLEVNWRRPQAQWSFTLGIAWGLSSPRLAGGDVVLHHEDEVERHDEGWVPPPAPYDRLRGRVTSLYLVSGISTTTTPDVAVEGREYGLGMLGAELGWDRDRWGGRHTFTPVLSLAAGLRATTGESTYLTGTVGLGVRWYFLGPLGLSVTAVRLEAGPKVDGTGEEDPSTGVHGSPGNEYYLLAGSRAGVALRLGIFDLLVESPTVAWTSDPFGAHEVLSFRLGIRVM